jgi:O-antigen/teichoic acid export membrane protein
MSEYKKAAVLSYANIILRNSLGIFLTPFIIQMLGKGDYGLYSLIGSFIAYLTVLDLGLNTTIIRYVAQYRAQKDKTGEENFIANIFLVNFFLTSIIAGLGFLMYYNTVYLFSDSLNLLELDKAKSMILILIFNIIVTIPGKALEGISMGYEKFVFPRAIAIVKYLSRTVLVVAILTQGADSLGLVILDTILNIIFTLVTLYYVFFVLKAIPKMHIFKLDFVKEIFGYSIWVFLFALVFQFKWSTGQVVLGVNTGTETVAIFAIGITLGMYFNAFGNVINGLLLPKVVQDVYEGISLDAQVNKLIDISRLTLFVLSYILVAFILFGKEFIYLWIGPGYEESWIVAILFMIAYIITIVQSYIHKILEAKKMLKFKSLSFLVFGVIGIVVGSMLSKKYEIQGMILSIVVFDLLLQILLNVYYQKVLKIPILHYFKKTFLSYAIPLIILFFLIYTLKQYYLEVNWLSFIIQAIVYSILFFISVYSFVFTNKEKEFLKRMLKIN